MVCLDGTSHDQLRKGGFHYDKTWDRYLSVREAIWEVERRVERGWRQLAVPARTKQEYIVEEDRMVTRLIKRLRARTASGGAEEEQKKVEVDPKTDKRVKVCSVALVDGADRGGEKPEAAAQEACLPPTPDKSASESEGSASEAEPFFNPVMQEVKLLQGQAAKLRAAIARRRANPGLSNETDNVPAIISHYEAVLAELEQRIARLTGRTDRA